MDAMFIIPAMPGTAQGLFIPSFTPSNPPKQIQQSHDTHDTSSDGSDNHVAKKPLQASTTSVTSPDSTHFRTLSTATIVDPPYEELDKETADDLVEKTEQRLQNVLLKSSAMFQPELSVDPVPTFRLEEDLVRGDLLGAGGFASVHYVDVKDPSRLRFHKSGQQYVLKHLAPKLRSNQKKLHLGAKDILIEAHILSALDHPNIIQVNGLSHGGVHSFATTRRTDAYFMILPRLKCTLADKITVWKRQRLQQIASDAADVEKNGPWWRRKRRTSASAVQKQMQQKAHDLQFLCERLQIIIDLCNALEYLHEKRVMHRDVKPPNIGFDDDGCLKLFDFGLAKELPPDSAAYTHEHSASKSRTFHHLGNTGTTRYMAPEVIRREPYNCKVDVFAASIVCWEIMTLKKPYGVDVSGQFVKECVAIYDDRPTIPTATAYSARRKHHTVWPKALKKTVQMGWVKNVGMRLTAKMMKEQLQDILDKKQRQQLQSMAMVPETPIEQSFSSTASMSC